MTFLFAIGKVDLTWEHVEVNPTGRNASLDVAREMALDKPGIDSEDLAFVHVLGRDIEA